MEIIFTNRGNRCQLRCVRNDGSYESAELGPSFPFHDIAHYVAETTLSLHKGFFGNIARGYTMKSLGSKEVIQTLGTEAWTAEILARALGSLSSGACRPEQFIELVNLELDKMRIPYLEQLNSDLVNDMLSKLQALTSAYSGLSEGESLTLNF